MAFEVKGVDRRCALTDDRTEGHDRLKLGNINEYLKSLCLVDFSVRPERVRMSASSGFLTGNEPSSESCSFYCGFALTSNTLGSSGLAERRGLKRRS